MAADLHVHSSVGSNDTGGDGTAAALAEAMTAAGLDVVWVTDHSNSLGSMDCADVEDCPNQGPEVPVADWPDGVFLGAELSPRDTGSEARGHVGCLPRASAGFVGLDAFIDRPFGEVSGKQSVDQCLAVGGFAIINHPKNISVAAHLDYDWTSEDFDAIEVYNGTLGYDPWDEEALLAWEQRVADGRPVVPVGGSDSHRWSSRPTTRGQNPGLGWPTTHLRVLDGEAPIDAVIAGRTVIAEPGTTLELVAYRGRTAVGPGESLPSGARYRLTASAVEDGMRLELKRPGGEVLDTAPLTGEVVLEGDLPDGQWYARVWPEEGVGVSQGGIAMTNVVRVGE